MAFGGQLPRELLGFALLPALYAAAGLVSASTGGPAAVGDFIRVYAAAPIPLVERAKAQVLVADATGRDGGRHCVIRAGSPGHGGNLLILRRDPSGDYFARWQGAPGEDACGGAAYVLLPERGARALGLSMRLHETAGLILAGLSAAPAGPAAD